MKTLLLLAGRSKRFWPLSEKSLFSICGRTVLEHQIDRLRAAGLTDITLVVGAHNKAAAAALFPQLPQIEQRELDWGMRGALLDALPSLGNGPVFIVSGNDVIESSGYAAVRNAVADGADGALLARTVDRYFPGGYLRVEEGRITNIVEKPGAGNEPSNLVNIVAHAHASASALLAALKAAASDRDDGYEVALQSLLSAKRYVAVPYNGVWQPIKYPWHLLPLLDVLLRDVKPRISPSASVHPTAVIEGNVTLGDGVKVFPGACIMGPCVIGARTIVGNGALVRGSSVGEDCVIGFQSEVKCSVLSDHVWMHSTYVGDSVIGRNVSFGAGSVTGNLRLDEGEIHSLVGEERLPTGLTKFGTVIGADCRFGIHAGINPGMKIGAGCFVASGVILAQDVPEATFVSMKKGEVILRPNTAKAPLPEARDAYKTSVVRGRGE